MDRVDVRALGRRIAAAADAGGGEGWMDVPVPDAVRRGGVLRVPRGAFEQWAVHLSRGGHLATPWKPISPSGLKQGADDPFHTDWMLGAGLGLRDMRHDGGNPHHEALSEAAYAARAAVEKRLLGFQCSVLLPGPAVRGVVVRDGGAGSQIEWAGDEPPILVMRDASSERLHDVLRVLDRGGAVIVERGGAMAHLVTEARSSGRGPIVRVPGALRLYPEGAMLSVAAAEGSVRMLEQAREFGLEDLAPVRLPPKPRRRAAPPPSPVDPSGIGLTIHKPGDPKPYDRLGWVMPAAKVEGRDFSAYGSLHSGSEIRDLNDGMLVVHVIPRKGGGGSKRTVFSQERRWGDAELRHACREALHLAVSAERPDSPETAAARAELDRIEHDWWLRGRRHPDDDALLRSAAEHLLEEDEIRNGTVVFEDAMEKLDAQISCDHVRRHFDIEFATRGLPHRMADIDPDAWIAASGEASSSHAEAPGPSLR